jgi:transposase
LLVGRNLLQAKLLDVELSLRGILRGFGLKMGEVRRARFAARVRELAAGHAMLVTISEAMLQAHEGLRQQFNRLPAQRLRLTRRDPVSRQRMTVPGVGAVVAITFRSAIDDPARFAKSRARRRPFWADPEEIPIG